MGLELGFQKLIILVKLIHQKKIVGILYSYTLVIAFSIFLIFSIVNIFLDWNTILNISTSFNENINEIFFYVFGLFCAQLYLKNVSTIILTLQKTSLNDFILLTINIVSLVAIIIIKKFGIIILNLPLSLFGNGDVILVGNL